MFRVSIPTFHYICGLVHNDLETHPPPGLCNDDIYLGSPGTLKACIWWWAYGGRGIVWSWRIYLPPHMSQIHYNTLTQGAPALAMAWTRGNRRFKKRACTCARNSSMRGCKQLHPHPAWLPANSNATDWYDRDHNYSMILQAIVDSNMRFIDAFAGFPGSIHDAKVFGHSKHAKLVNQDNVWMVLWSKCTELVSRTLL